MAEMENCSGLEIKIEIELNECGGEKMSEGQESEVKGDSSGTKAQGLQSLPRIKKRKMEGDEKVLIRGKNVNLLWETEQLRSNSLDEAEKMINEDMKKSVEHEVTENAFIEDRSCEMDENEIVPNCESPDPAWQNYVGKLKVEMKVKVCAKKRQYLGLLDKKEALSTAVNKSKEIRKERQQSIELITEHISSNKGMIADSKEEIEKLQEDIKIKSKQNAQMQAYVKQEALKLEKSCRNIEDVGSTFNKIEDEVASVLEVNERKSDPVERDEVDVNKERDAEDVNKFEFDNLKEVLIGLVCDYKKQLTCPVCHQLSNPPIYKCPAEHLICSSCYAGKVRTRCPQCSLQLDKTGLTNTFKSAEVAWRELKKLEDKLSQ